MRTDHVDLPPSTGDPPAKRSRFDALLPLASIVIAGAALFAIHVITSEKSAPSKPPATAAPPASAIREPAALTPPAMPDGWRGLKFGMSEADVKRSIDEERRDTKEEWSLGDKTRLPTVRWKVHALSEGVVDRKRYRQWTIRALDDGAETVDAWHEGGRLVALRVKGRADPDAFIRKASEAYGAKPENVKFTFADDRTNMQETRDVAVWRGSDMTALVWTSGSSPILLLWSNAALTEREADFESEMGAPAVAARKAAKQSEVGTKF